MNIEMSAQKRLKKQRNKSYTNKKLMQHRSEMNGCAERKMKLI